MQVQLFRDKAESVEMAQQELGNTAAKKYESFYRKGVI